MEEHTGTASTPRGFLLPQAGSTTGMFGMSFGFLTKLVVFSGRKVVVPGTGVTGVIVTGGAGSMSQSPKRSSSASHSASRTPGQQPFPESSQFSALGTQAGSVSTSLSSQHPSPKRSQSGPLTQGGSSSQHLVSKRLQSGGGVQSSSSSPPWMKPPLGSHPNLSRYSLLYWAVLEKNKNVISTKIFHENTNNNKDFLYLLILSPIGMEAANVKTCRATASRRFRPI